MPTIAEILRAEGLEISPELEKKLPTLVEAPDETRGLVATKDELLKFKQDNADKIAGFESMQAKYEEELNEREKLAIANKDFEEQIKIRDERAQRQEAIIKQRNEQALNGTKESSEMEIASLFSCSQIGRSLAKNFVNAEINDYGQISKTYTLEGKTFESFDEFKQEATKVEWLASQMKGLDNTGPSVSGGNGSAPKNDPDSAYAQRMKDAGLI